MTAQRVVIIGAGVAGMAAAILLARAGCRVTVLERDALDVGRPEDAPARDRPGVPHYLQPHAFIPRGRLELRAHLPEVYADLLDAGAAEVDLRHKLPGEPRPEDEALQYLAVRRPVVEWALRRRLAAENGVERRAHVRARALEIESGRVTGVRTDDGPLVADLVVDAHGRRDGKGAFVPSPVRTSSCGVVYYSRYYRCRPGFTPPDGPWFLSPRGDLGYLAFASFPGDDGTFAAVLAVPPGVAEWRALADAAAFEAAVATIPSLRSWVDPEGVEPITAVLPMAGLQNRLLDDPAPMPGVVAIGDAYCHTDPTLAHGLPFGLIHAVALADAVGGEEIGDAFRAATATDVRERYEWATPLDEQRLRAWLGGPVDLSPTGDYALFTVAAGGAVARVDPTVFRVFNRRLTLLDRTSVLDGDPMLQNLIAERFAEMRATPIPPLGPPREEMLRVIAAASAG